MSVNPTRTRTAYPTFSDLLRVRNATPASIEAATGISCSTVYRAKRGRRVVRAHLALIAAHLRLPVESVAAAIDRSAER